MVWKWAPPTAWQRPRPGTRARFSPRNPNSSPPKTRGTGTTTASEEYCVPPVTPNPRSSTTVPIPPAFVTTNPTPLRLQLRSCQLRSLPGRPLRQHVGMLGARAVRLSLLPMPLRRRVRMVVAGRPKRTRQRVYLRGVSRRNLQERRHGQVHRLPARHLPTRHRILRLRILCPHFGLRRRFGHNPRQYPGKHCQLQRRQRTRRRSRVRKRVRRGHGHRLGHIGHQLRRGRVCWRRPRVDSVRIRAIGDRVFFPVRPTRIWRGQGEVGAS